ncbi:MAG: hypothetical protein PHI15_00700 [Methanomicrobium sp.]|nr:hypothetical protein [Methanomicrobium sp.]
MKKRSLDALKGENLEDKLKTIGIIKGEESDVLELDKLGKKYGLEIILYFEKDLAINSTYEKDLIDFKDEDEFGRPFISAERFLKFGQENDPTFENRLTEFPLMITIAEFGERINDDGSKKNYIKGLMPFLDEFDVDKEPGPVIGDSS